MSIQEQIRQWLVAHQHSISYKEANISKTITATRAEWDEFYRLLSLKEEK